MAWRQRNVAVVQAVVVSWTGGTGGPNSDRTPFDSGGFGSARGSQQESQHWDPSYDKAYPSECRTIGV